MEALPAIAMHELATLVHELATKRCCRSAILAGVMENDSVPAAGHPAREGVPGPKTSAGGWRRAMDTLTNVLMCLAAVAVLWSVGREFVGGGARAATAVPREIPVPAEPQSLDGAEVMGSPSAAVVVIEYTDIKCPYCGKFARETLPAFERDYVATGKVRLAFRNLPLESIHPEALGAAVAAVCAGRQGRFWALHDALFNDQAHLDEPGLRAHAKDVGLDPVTFDTCRADPSIEQAVRRDEAAAKTLGINGTPTFLIGRAESDGRVKVTAVVTGARSEADLVKALGQPAAGS